MRAVTTRDGSVTFHSEQVDEHYHSTTVGALEEARVKYVEPCELKDGDKILDFCFGLGYNSLAALAITKKLHIVGIELDPNILDKIQEIEVPDPYKELYPIIQKTAKKLYYKDGNTEIQLYVEDASVLIHSMREDYDAILFDPFSPKKAPNLWTLDVFMQCYRILKPGGRLTTYSCARHVRENLAAAGFKVLDGPIFGRKSPATLAVKP